MILACAACSHTLTVNTVQTGSRIYVDDEEVGGDEVTTTTSTGFFGSVRIKAEHDDYTPLEVEIDRQHTSWPLLIGALGGCLGGGCLGAGCGLMSGLVVFPQGSPLYDGGPETMMVTGSLLTGLPFLGLLLLLHHGPDAVTLDLESGRVTTLPPTNFVVVQAPSPRRAATGSTQPEPTDQATEQPQPTPQDPPAQEEKPHAGPSGSEEPGADPEMEPFTY